MNYCAQSVDRMKRGPDNWEFFLNLGQKYTDISFWDKEQLYWPFFSDFKTGADYEWDLLTQ